MTGGLFEPLVSRSPRVTPQKGGKRPWVPPPRFTICGVCQCAGVKLLLFAFVLHFVLQVFVPSTFLPSFVLWSRVGRKGFRCFWVGWFSWAVFSGCPSPLPHGPPSASPPSACQGKCCSLGGTLSALCHFPTTSNAALFAAIGLVYGLLLDPFLGVLLCCGPGSADFSRLQIA